MNVSQTIRYGVNSRIQVSLPADALVAHCGDPRGKALDDPVAAVTAALVDPLQYPPLADSTVPGDRVVIAVENGVPQLPAVVAGVVEGLLEGCVAPGNVQILLSAESTCQHTVKSCMSASYAGELSVQTHDPSDRGKLAYLATTQSGTPIYINRAICDADVVIPVGCLRADGGPGSIGGLSGVYPSFADSETLERFRAPHAIRSTDGLSGLAHELEEATWLLGSRFTVQTIPAGGDGLLDVLSGDLDAVHRAGQEHTHFAWDFFVPQRASLVVAALEGGMEQQSSGAFARALLAALRVVEDDGTIAVCTELDRRPGPALSLLIGRMDLDLDKVEAEMCLHHRVDTLAATQLVDAMRRVRVYLLSRLDGNLVEDLGLAYIEHPQEVANLCRRHPSCTLLANAQHAWPSVVADSVVSP